MTQQEPVNSSVEDGIAVIRIANPPVNALSAAVRGGLKRAAEAAAADPAASTMARTAGSAAPTSPNSASRPCPRACRRRSRPSNP